jgi:hypothetical protein
LVDWDEHNPPRAFDKSNAERQRRWRDRQKLAKRVVATPDLGGVTRNVTLRNGPRVEEELELTLVKDTTASPSPETLEDGASASAAQRKTLRGRRWGSGEVVPIEWVQEGRAYRELAKLPPADLETAALEFANYWASRSGRDALKLDWRRTWLNRCLTVKGLTHGSTKTHSRQSRGVGGTLEAIAGEIDAARRKVHGG